VRAAGERPHDLRIGCSGWNYAHWRNGVFYPPRLAPGAWLRFYAGRFDTVELNTSFYRLPRRASAERWAAETPDDFVFAVKVSRYITHIKRLQDVPEHLPLLYERIEPLRPKLGVFLWQLPPTFKADLDRLATALEQLPRGERHAFEFRHPSWFTEETYTLLREHEVALVVVDDEHVELTAPFTYVRFHRGLRGRNGNYSHRELAEWAKRLRRWSADADVYAYFNNDWEGYAIENALWLKDELRAGDATRSARA
jgi:uncharacterized protein YecE (DUF72 family)